MFFPVKRRIEPRLHGIREVKKFAWLPVTIEWGDRVYGTVWLEHYTLQEQCDATDPQEVWRKVGTFYPACDD